ncbi:MAG: hypothetical protein U0U66_04095 [Cytophagaceae bacterium]
MNSDELYDSLTPEVLASIYTETIYVFPDTTVKEVVAASPKATSPSATTDSDLKFASPPEMPAAPTAVKTAPPVTPSIPKMEPKKEVESNLPTYRPLGKFTNGLLFVQHAKVESTPTQRDLLKNIIVNGIKYNHEDCGYLKIDTPISLAAIEKLPARIVVFFGIATDSFSPELKKEYYQIQRYNKLTILLSDSLASLEEKKELKGKLWNSLKELFGIR